jgi:hypothetical protein
MPWSPQQDCDQKQMRPGPAIRAASFVDLSSCHPAARDGEPTVLVRQRSRMSATFTSTGCRAAILRITSPPPLRWPAANPLQEREVEEAAMPGQPVRTRARFRMSLAIHPQELPAATSVTAIVVRQALRNPTFSLHPLCGRMSRPAIENRSPLVQKLWTIVLPCGNLRKFAPKLRPRKCRSSRCNNLHAVKK